MLTTLRGCAEWARRRFGPGSAYLRRRAQAHSSSNASTPTSQQVSGAKCVGKLTSEVSVTPRIHVVIVGVRRRLYRWINQRLRWRFPIHFTCLSPTIQILKYVTRNGLNPELKFCKTSDLYPNCTLHMFLRSTCLQKRFSTNSGLHMDNKNTLICVWSCLKVISILYKKACVVVHAWVRVKQDSQRIIAHSSTISTHMLGSVIEKEQQLYSLLQPHLHPSINQREPKRHGCHAYPNEALASPQPRVSPFHLNSRKRKSHVVQSSSQLTGLPELTYALGYVQFLCGRQRVSGWLFMKTNAYAICTCVQFIAFAITHAGCSFSPTIAR